MDKTESIEIVHLPADQVWTVWEDIEPFVQRAADHGHGEVTMATFRDQLMTGNERLILIKEGDKILGCVSHCIYVAPSGKRYLDVPLIGGERFDEYKDAVMETLKMLKKGFMCDVIRGGGRSGWVRYLKDLGFKQTQTFVEYS